MPLTQRGITNPETPAQHFAYWLPGELEYSARKAGYQEKIRRADLPIEDPQSMYQFLTSEWFQHRKLLKDGVHYLPFHGMSAQLQAAKFAAGLYDKVALIEWLGSQHDATTDQYTFSARWIGNERSRGIYLYDDAVASSMDFSDYGDRVEDTPFAEGIRTIIDTVSLLAYNREMLNQNGHSIKPFLETVGGIARLATRYYVSYAQEHLTPEQYELPISELARTDQLHSPQPE